MKKVTKKDAKVGTDAGIHRKLFAKLMKDKKAQKAYNAVDAGKPGRKNR